MNLSVRDCQRIQQLLRNVAEVDPDDVTANRASQLGVDLELKRMTISYVDDLTVAEQELIQYAFSKRDVYVLEKDAKHAKNLEKGIDHKA